MSRQTKTFLLERFRQMGVTPATRHGQNFLIDLNLQQLIVDAARIGPNDVVLEIGTGTGALTSLMARRAAAVVTVEIDARLFEMASEALLDCSNVTMLRMDALHNKNRFEPQVLAAIEQRLAEGPDRRFKLAANLPYNIATPVLSNLLAGSIVPHSMVATIQKELADRIAAQPRSKDYSALSVWMQIQADCEIVRLLPPSVFWPAPKVHSAIVRIVVDPERRSAIPDLDYFHQFVKALFLHRRKFLRANLVAAFKGPLSKEAIDEEMAAMNFSPTVRTEELAPSILLQLAERMRRLAPDWKR